MKQKLHRVGLVFCGIVLGCAGATVAPLASSSAQPRQGQWQCFVIDAFPNPQRAADWGPARDISEGLNQVALHTPPGTIFNSYWNEKNSITCVKY